MPHVTSKYTFDEGRELWYRFASGRKERNGDRHELLGLR